MDPTSEGCRLCLDPFTESFTTIDSPQLKDQMGKVFCFAIEPKPGYCSGVCQSCSCTISEFYQYSEKVRQNQEVLEGKAAKCDSTEEDDSKPTLELVKAELLSDSAGLPETTTEDACEPPEEEAVSGGEDFPDSGDDESYEPPPKKAPAKRRGRSKKSKADDDLDSEEPTTKNSKSADVLKRKQARNEEDQLFNKHYRMICDLCGTSAATYTALRAHYRKEHNRRDGYVVCCNRKFFHRYGMRDHIKFHANPDAFRCEICGNKYKNKDSLNCHVSTHHSDNPRTMICDACGKEFMSKQSFDRHMNEHLGTGRVQCDICQRWLKSERSLRNHINWLHKETNREFQCDICQQKYPHSLALYNHKYKTHAEPKHECGICGKKFKMAISLKEHRATHTGEVLYSCEHCGIPKTRKKQLYDHIKQQHPVEWAQMKLMATLKGGPP